MVNTLELLSPFKSCRSYIGRVRFFYKQNTTKHNTVLLGKRHIKRPLKVKMYIYRVVVCFLATLENDSQLLMHVQGSDLLPGAGKQRRVVGFGPFLGAKKFRRIDPGP